MIMKTIMNKEYKKELANLKARMVQAEKFAAKLPLFSKEILQGKYTEEHDHVSFGNRYKELYLDWGIGRGLFEEGTNRSLTNYRGGYYKKYLFHIYINTLCIYDSHEKFDLNEIVNKTDVFYYDTINSTFYATDEQIEGLLDALCVWKIKACEQIKEYNKTVEIKELKGKLAKLTDSE